MTSALTQTTVDDTKIYWAVSAAEFILIDNNVHIDPIISRVGMDTATYHIPGQSTDVVVGGTPEGRAITITGQVSPVDGDMNQALDDMDSLWNYLKGDPADGRAFRLYTSYHASDTTQIRYYYPCYLLDFAPIDPIFRYGHHADWPTFSASIFAAYAEVRTDAAAASSPATINGPVTLNGNLIVRDANGETIVYINRATGDLYCAGRIRTQLAPGFPI